jgi:hypothetical protein
MILQVIFINNFADLDAFFKINLGKTNQIKKPAIMAIT